MSNIHIENKTDKKSNKNYQEKIILVKDDSFESIENKDLNLSLDKNIDLEDFLSKKFDGLLEGENLMDDYEERNELGGKMTNLNQNNEKENYRDNQGLKEILEIIRKAWCDKSLVYKNTPFKRLTKPKKFSLSGRILINYPEN